jgi:hypothetical protein
VTSDVSKVVTPDVSKVVTSDVTRTSKGTTKRTVNAANAAVSSLKEEKKEVGDEGRDERASSSVGNPQRLRSLDAAQLSTWQTSSLIKEAPRDRSWSEVQNHWGRCDRLAQEKFGYAASNMVRRAARDGISPYYVEAEIERQMSLDAFEAALRSA